MVEVGERGTGSPFLLVEMKVLSGLPKVTEFVNFTKEGIVRRERRVIICTHEFVGSLRLGTIPFNSVIIYSL